MCALNLSKDIDQFKRLLQKLYQEHPRLHAIVSEVYAAGGKVYLVGGAVRDVLLGLCIADIDCEVHGLSSDALEAMLSVYGLVYYQGKSFGILRVENVPVDWSLPRRDSVGRKPIVTVDPFMTIEKALRRRDVTMNAMAVDMHTFEFIDPFGGLSDLEKRLLRAPDPSFFVHDPLRFFRVMQFIGRFEMEPDETLNELCKTISLVAISRERIAQEFIKLFKLSRQPSRGIRWLLKIGRLQEIAPELAVLEKTPQSGEYHPEGNVFEHSMQTLDAAAMLTHENPGQRFLLLVAALCHDLGKATTTTIEPDGRIRSIGHDEAGVPIARALVRRIFCNHTLADNVSILVRHHMAPGIFVAQNARPAAYKRLAAKLPSWCSLSLLAFLAICDRRGRNAHSPAPLSGPVDVVELFCERAKRAGVLYQPEPAVVVGSDLLDLGIEPGPELGTLLHRAYLIQINKSVRDKKELLKRILAC